MRGMQDSFPRCKKCLPSESYKRRLVLEAIVSIHNYRTEFVGSNHFKTILKPEYEHVINREGYDRFSKYYCDQMIMIWMKRTKILIER
jgi:hypothetical protein